MATRLGSLLLRQSRRVGKTKEFRLVETRDRRMVKSGMIADRDFGSDRPVTWIGSFPIYVSTILAGVHGVTMLLTAIASAMGAEALIQALVFSSSGMFRDSQVWQVVTYAFVHLPPYWLLLVELYLLVVFGTEIEKFLGRRAFIQLYATLLLLPPLVLAVAGMLGFPSVLAGSNALHFGVMAAFAMLYPRAEILFSVQARWVVAAFFAVNAIQFIALSQYVGLGVLVLDTAAACLLVAHMKFGAALFPAKREKVAVARPVKVAPKQRPIAESIDPILDKISRSGLASLTAQERRALERAREELLAKEESR